MHYLPSPAAALVVHESLLSRRLLAARQAEEAALRAPLSLGNGAHSSSLFSSPAGTPAASSSKVSGGKATAAQPFLLLGASTAQHPAYSLYYNDSALLMGDAAAAPDFSTLVTPQEVLEVARQRRSFNEAAASAGGEGGGSDDPSSSLGGGGGGGSVDLEIGSSNGIALSYSNVAALLFSDGGEGKGGLRGSRGGRGGGQSSSSSNSAASPYRQLYATRWGNTADPNAIAAPSRDAFACTQPHTIIDSFGSLRALEAPSGGAAFSVLLTAPDRTVQWPLRAVVRGYAVTFVRGVWEDAFAEEQRAAAVDRFRAAFEEEEGAVKGLLCPPPSHPFALLSSEGSPSPPSHSPPVSSFRTVSPSLAAAMRASMPTPPPPTLHHDESPQTQPTLLTPAIGEAAAAAGGGPMVLTPLDITAARLKPMPHGAPHVRCVYADATGVLLHRNLSAAVCGTWGLRVSGAGGADGVSSAADGVGQTNASLVGGGVAIVRGVMDVRTWEPNTLEALLRPGSPRLPAHRLTRLAGRAPLRTGGEHSTNLTAAADAEDALATVLSVLPDTAAFAAVPNTFDAMLLPRTATASSSPSSSSLPKGGAKHRMPPKGESGEVAALTSTFRSTLLGYLTTGGQTCGALEAANAPAYAHLASLRGMRGVYGGGGAEDDAETGGRGGGRGRSRYGDSNRGGKVGGVIPYVVPWGRPLVPAYPPEALRPLSPSSSPSTSSPLPPSLLLPARPLHEVAAGMPVGGEYAWVPRSFGKTMSVLATPLWLHSEEVEVEARWGEGLRAVVDPSALAQSQQQPAAKEERRRQRGPAVDEAAVAADPRLAHLLTSPTGAPTLLGGMPATPKATSPSSPSHRRGDAIAPPASSSATPHSAPSATSTAPTTALLTTRRFRRCVIELELPSAALFGDGINQLVTAVPRSPDQQEASGSVRTFMGAPLMWTGTEHDLIFHLQELRLASSINTAASRRRQEFEAEARGGGPHGSSSSSSNVPQQQQRVVMEPSAENIRRHALSFRNFRITHIDGVALDQDFAEAEGALRKLRTQSTNDHAHAFQARYPLTSDTAFSVYNAEHTARSDVQKGTGSVGAGLDRMTAQLLSNKGLWALMAERTSHGVLSFWLSARLPIEILRFSLIHGGKTSGADIDMSGNGHDRPARGSESSSGSGGASLAASDPALDLSPTRRLWASIRTVSSAVWGLNPFKRIYTTNGAIQKVMGAYYDRGSESTTCSASERAKERPHFSVSLRLVPRLLQSSAAAKGTSESPATPTHAARAANTRVESFRRVLSTRRMAADFSANIQSLATFSLTRRLYSKRQRLVEDPAAAFLSEGRLAALLRPLWDPRHLASGAAVRGEMSQRQMPHEGAQEEDGAVSRGGGGGRNTTRKGNVSEKEGTVVGGWDAVSDAYAQTIIPRKAGRALREKWAHILYRPESSARPSNPHHSRDGGAIVNTSFIGATKRAASGGSVGGELNESQLNALFNDVAANRNRQAIVSKIWASLERATWAHSGGGEGKKEASASKRVKRTDGDDDEAATTTFPSPSIPNGLPRETDGLRTGAGAAPSVPSYDLDALLSLGAEANLQGGSNFFRVRIQSDEPVEVIAEMARHHLGALQARLVAEEAEALTAEGAHVGPLASVGGGDVADEVFVAAAAARGWARAADDATDSAGDVTADAVLKAAFAPPLASSTSISNDNKSARRGADSLALLATHGGGGGGSDSAAAATLQCLSEEDYERGATPFASSPLRRLTALQREYMGISLGLAVGAALPHAVTLGGIGSGGGGNNSNGAGGWWQAHYAYHTLRMAHRYGGVGNDWGREVFSYYLRPQFPVFISGLMMRPMSGISVFEREVNSLRCELALGPTVDLSLHRAVRREAVEASEAFRALRSLVRGGGGGANSTSSSRGEERGTTANTRVIEVKAVSSRDGVACDGDAVVSTSGPAILSPPSPSSGDWDMVAAQRHNNALPHLLRRLPSGMALFAPSGGGAGAGSAVDLGDGGEGLFTGAFARHTNGELTGLTALGALSAVVPRTVAGVVSAPSASRRGSPPRLAHVPAARSVGSAVRSAGAPLPASLTATATGAFGGNAPIRPGAKIADYGQVWQACETTSEQLKPLVVTSVAVVQGGGVSAASSAFGRAHLIGSAAKVSKKKEGGPATAFYGHQLNTIRLAITFARRHHPAALTDSTTRCAATRFIAKNRLSFDTVIAANADANDWSRVDDAQWLRELRRLLSGSSVDRNDSAAILLPKSTWGQMADQRDHRAGEAAGTYRTALAMMRAVELNADAAAVAAAGSLPSATALSSSSTYSSIASSASLAAAEDPTARANSVAALTNAISLNSAWGRHDAYAIVEHFTGGYWEARVRAPTGNAYAVADGRTTRNAERFLFTHANGCIPSPTAPWRFATFHTDFIDTRMISLDSIGAHSTTAAHSTTVVPSSFAAIAGVAAAIAAAASVEAGPLAPPLRLLGRGAANDAEADSQAALWDRRWLIRSVADSTCGRGSDDSGRSTPPNANTTNTRSGTSSISSGAAGAPSVRSASPSTTDTQEPSPAICSAAALPSTSLALPTPLAIANDASNGVFVPTRFIPDTLQLAAEQSLAEEIFGQTALDTNSNSTAWDIQCARIAAGATVTATLAKGSSSSNTTSSSIGVEIGVAEDTSAGLTAGMAASGGAAVFHYARMGHHGRFIKAMVLDATLRTGAALVVEELRVATAAAAEEKKKEKAEDGEDGLAAVLAAYGRAEVEAQLSLFIALYGATRTDLLSSDMVLDLVWGQPTCAKGRYRYRPLAARPLQQRLSALLPTGAYRNSLPTMVSEESAVTAAALMSHFAPSLWRAFASLEPNGYALPAAATAEEGDNDGPSQLCSQAVRVWRELLPLIGELRAVYEGSAAFHATIATSSRITSTPHSNNADHYTAVGSTDLFEVFAPSSEARRDRSSLSKAYFATGYAPRQQ